MSRLRFGKNHYRIAEVGAIHPKAMPVILTTLEECDASLSAPTAEAVALQRPHPDGALRIVARGETKDEMANGRRRSCPLPGTVLI